MTEEEIEKYMNPEARQADQERRDKEISKEPPMTLLERKKIADEIKAGIDRIGKLNANDAVIEAKKINENIAKEIEDDMKYRHL